MSKIVDAYIDGWKKIAKWYKDGNEKGRIKLQKIDEEWEEKKKKYELEKQQVLEEARKEKERRDEENRIFSEELDRKFEEQEERRRRFKAKDKTLVLTRSEYFWWKIFPIIVKLIGIIFALFVVFIYSVWYFVIIPLFVGYLLLELFFWYMDM